MTQACSILKTPCVKEFGVADFPTLTQPCGETITNRDREGELIRLRRILVTNTAVEAVLTAQRFICIATAWSRPGYRQTPGWTSCFSFNHHLFITITYKVMQLQENTWTHSTQQESSMSSCCNKVLSLHVEYVMYAPVWIVHPLLHSLLHILLLLLSSNRWIPISFAHSASLWLLNTMGRKHWFGYIAT